MLPTYKWRVWFSSRYAFQCSVSAAEVSDQRLDVQGAVCAKAAAATKSGARSGTRPGPDLTVFRYGAEPERGSLAEIYRQRTGLLAPGEDMGGWYDDFCPGAHFGQYVSAP